MNVVSSVSMMMRSDIAQQNVVNPRRSFMVSINFSAGLIAVVCHFLRQGICPSRP